MLERREGRTAEMSTQMQPEAHEGLERGGIRLPPALLEEQRDTVGSPEGVIQGVEIQR